MRYYQFDFFVIIVQKYKKISKHQMIHYSISK